MNEEKEEPNTFWVTIVAFILIFAISIGIIILLQQKADEELRRQYDFNVKNIVFTDSWLNLTVVFRKLPKEGAYFTKIQVSSMQRKLNTTFTTGDRINVNIEHNDSLIGVPTHLIIWENEHIWHIPITFNRDTADV